MAEYKKICCIFYTDKLSEREIKKTISFTISSKRIKYSRWNLTKDLKDPYVEKCKISTKEIKDK